MDEVHRQATLSDEESWGFTECPAGQSAEQKAGMETVWGGVKGAGVLDFVTAWHLKAAPYLTAAASPPSFANMRPSDANLSPPPQMHANER